jgi:putative transposase
MRYPASEKLEIIRTVEASHLPTKQTLKMLGIPSSTYYDWYARWSKAASMHWLDCSPCPKSVWNRIPEDGSRRCCRVCAGARDLTPGSWRSNTPMRSDILSRNHRLYRILKAAEDLITAPAYVVIRAADEFKDKTTAIERAVADRLHLSQGHRLGLVLSQHDPRRLQPLHHRLEALHDDEGRGCDRHAGTGAGGIGLRRRHVVHKPRLLSDNGSSYVAADLAES